LSQSESKGLKSPGLVLGNRREGTREKKRGNLRNRRGHGGPIEKKREKRTMQVHHTVPEGKEKRVGQEKKKKKRHVKQQLIEEKAGNSDEAGNLSLSSQKGFRREDSEEKRKIKERKVKGREFAI